MLGRCHDKKLVIRKEQGKNGDDAHEHLDGVIELPAMNADSAPAEFRSTNDVHGFVNHLQTDFKDNIKQEATVFLHN